MSQFSLAVAMAETGVRGVATPVETIPTPVEITVTPVLPTVTPVAITATPAASIPTPVEITATPVETTPLPVVTTPMPAETAPMPVDSPPTPVANAATHKTTRKLSFTSNPLLDYELSMRLNTGFSNLTPAKLADKADAIFAALNDNAFWPTTTPALAQVEAATATLRGVLAKPKGTPGRTANLKTAAAALAALLTQLGAFLMDTPNVTLAMLETTGFDLAKTPARATAPPPAPGDLVLGHSPNPGEVTGDCHGSEGAHSYEWEWTLDPVNGPWNDGGAFTNTRNIVMAGLPRGKDVWIRVRALGTKGFSPWSDPATIMAT